MRFVATACLLVLSICGCTGSALRSENEHLGNVAQELIPTTTLLPNNLVVLPTTPSNPTFENTVRVVPPSTKPTAFCPNGGIGLVTGQSPTEFAFRPLLDGSGKIDFAISSTTTTAFPAIASTFIGTDNQVVRMKDGSLLAVKGGNSWSITHPPLLYGNETVNDTPGTQHHGERGGNMYFFRSTDCGATWSLWSAIDFGTFNGGRYGFPRPAAIVNGQFQADVPLSQQGHNADGTLMWWIGGGDREELYACPFNGNVYLTVHIVSGPYPACAAGVCGPSSQISNDLLIMSTDGRNWSLVKDDLPASAPLVMTSTPNGRLFLLRIGAGGVPTVHFSQPLQPGATPQVDSIGSPASFIENGSPIASSFSDHTRGLMMIKSDTNTGLAVKADGGAREGGALKLSSSCVATDPDCTWSYVNGMILSDSNPALAITAGTGAEVTALTLTTACDPSKPQCTWTYKKGEFLSDKSPTRAMNAWMGARDGAALLLTGLCSAANTDCTWTLPHVEISSATNVSLRAWGGGAVNAVPVTLSDTCDATNTDCTWTFSKGMITSDINPSLAFNAAGGATNLATIKLSSICSVTNASCTWTWTKGALVSDGSGATPLPINAFGGAKAGASLLLNSACNSGPNSDCVFSVFNEAVDQDRSDQYSVYLSRLSTDTASSKVRVVYPSLNKDNMEEARIVNFDADNPNSPSSVITVRTASPQNHSVMFTTFIDPDYLDMPLDEASNTSILYWEEAPTLSASSHTYSARYLWMSGTSNVSTPAPLSVLNGNSRTWPTRVALGDYVTGGFFWRNKTLNYLAQWIEPQPDGVKANIVTVNSPVHGFMIESDRNLGLAFNAAGGVGDGVELKLSSICSVTNSSCTWSYRNGMIVSDGDPTLALTASAQEGAHVHLSSTCNPSIAACTWTYKTGEFLSDVDPSLAINAWGGAVNAATLLVTRFCSASNPDCTWTLPHVELSSAQDTRLSVKPSGASANAVPLTLSNTCTAANTDCTWTFTKGMISSDTDSTLAFNATGGSNNLAIVKLSSICGPTNPSCTWTWTKGEIVTDGSATPLAINASGGAVLGATLLINSACTAANNDCVFSGYFAR